MSASSGPARPQAAMTEQSAFYKAVMTPVIFVTFLVSLVLVDYHNSAKRSRYHAEPESRWLPQWLHRIIYRARTYQYVSVHDEKKQTVSVDAQGRPSCYHSQQRKLMKMEAAEAFEIRNSVVFILGFLMACGTWGLWRIFSWGSSLLHAA